MAHESLWLSAITVNQESLSFYCINYMVLYGNFSIVYVFIWRMKLITQWFVAPNYSLKAPSILLFHSSCLYEKLAPIPIYIYIYA